MMPETNGLDFGDDYRNFEVYDIRDFCSY